MPEEGEKKEKKKKKSKKEKPVEEAPPPEPEPEPEAPPAEPEAPPAESAAEDAPVEGDAAPTEDGAPAEGEAIPMDEENMEMPPPPQQKKKPKFFVHWDRRKPKFYDYNFDFGESYYSGIVNYLANRKNDAIMDLPRRQNWAERGIHTSIARKSCPDMTTEHLLRDVRSSIRGFEDSQRNYGLECHRKYL